MRGGLRAQEAGVPVLLRALRGRWGGARTCDMAFKNEISLKRDRAGFTGAPSNAARGREVPVLLVGCWGLVGTGFAL